MGRKIRLLLVEDMDDPHVARALLREKNLPTEYKAKKSDRHLLYTIKFPSDSPSAIELDVKIAHGEDDALKRLPTECKASDLERLAVIVDADEDFSSRWDQVKARLSDAGCTNIPASAPKEGLVVEVPDGPKVGVWIMPDNASPGMLEDFTLRLIPADDPVLPLVRAFVDSIPENIRPFSPQHTAKVLVHSWLALRANPGKPLGLAITFHYLDPNSPHCELFCRWLR